MEVLFGWLGVLLLLLPLLPLFVSRKRWTRVRGSLDEMTRRHPGSIVRRAELGQGFADSIELQEVEFVVGNRTGLSFRDGFGHEERKVVATDIATIMAIPSGDGGQWARVADESGTILVEFWSPEQVVADLQNAVRA